MVAPQVGKWAIPINHKNRYTALASISPATDLAGQNPVHSRAKEFEVSNNELASFKIVPLEEHYGRGGSGAVDTRRIDVVAHVDAVLANAPG